MDVVILVLFMQGVDVITLIFLDSIKVSLGLFLTGRQNIHLKSLNKIKFWNTFNLFFGIGGFIPILNNIEK